MLTWLLRLARFRVRLGFLVGAVAIWLATPTWSSLALGASVALCGEALRFWAAGHLEKGKEVTRSGPYRWVRHPLYLGSAMLGVGFALAAWQLAAAALVLGYLAVTVGSTIPYEEEWLRARFGPEYDRYLGGALAPSDRRFSFERAMGNREHRTIGGIVAVLVVLAWKASRGGG